MLSEKEKELQLQTQRKYYDTMLDLFSHDGWKLVVEEMKENNEMLKNAALTAGDCSDTPNNVWFMRGRSMVYLYILGMEELLREQQEQLEIDVQEDTLEFGEEEENEVDGISSI